MDGIKGIGGKQITGANVAGVAGSTGDKGKVDFSKSLSDAINKVNTLQKDADISVEKLSAGKASLHETMVAIEKAGLSFQLMLQVRSKIVTAYEDIMRTQV